MIHFRTRLHRMANCNLVFVTCVLFAMKLFVNILGHMYTKRLHISLRADI